MSRAVRDSTLVAWYRSIYAPRMGGAYESHHRTAEIAGHARRRCGVAARGARAAAGDAGAAGLARHGSPRWAGFGQGLNEIGPTIVLLTSWDGWRTDDESVYAATDDDTIQVSAVR